eukprot:SAG31_NODE_6638_length_1943_cov_1.436009_2_plen_166_part_00
MPRMPVDAAVIGLASRLLRSQVQCVLATVSSRGPPRSAPRPATHLMAYGIDDNLQVVYFATARSSRKARHMTASSAVSVLWDNRTGNVADHLEGCLVTASGTAAHASTPAAASKAILTRNPNLRAFLAEDSTAFFAVKVEEYSVVVGNAAPARWDPREDRRLSNL